ncbi:MAG TPA: hypothetical protein VJ225_00030 [Nitrososphaeraceae archaeon]|nr:hypothetical protein [Nitrososphaeraceae archaeon]
MAKLNRIFHTLLSSGKDRSIISLRHRLRSWEKGGGLYRNGCKTKVALPKISASRESIPIGATKNNWNRNFRWAMITIITMMIYDYVN